MPDIRRVREMARSKKGPHRRKQRSWFPRQPGEAYVHHFVRPPNLPPYLPLASRVKSLQIINFERQVVFLLATSPVYRKANAKMRSEEYENRKQLRIGVEKGTNDGCRSRSTGYTEWNWTELSLEPLTRKLHRNSSQVQ